MIVEPPMHDGRLQAGVFLRPLSPRFWQAAAASRDRSAPSNAAAALSARLWPAAAARSCSACANGSSTAATFALIAASQSQEGIEAGKRALVA